MSESTNMPQILNLIRIRGNIDAALPTITTVFGDRIAQTKDNTPNTIYINAPTVAECDRVVHELSNLNVDLSGAEIASVTISDGDELVTSRYSLEDVKADKELAQSFEMPSLIGFDEDDDAELQELKAGVEEEKQQAFEREQAAEQARIAEEKARAAVEEQRIAEEEAQAAAEEVADKQRREAVGRNVEGMLAYLSEFELPIEQLVDVVLPKFTSADATKAIALAVTEGTLSASRKRVGAVLPAVSLTIENDTMRSFSDTDIDYDDPMSNDLLLQYLEKSEQLATAYDNARFIVNTLSDEDFELVQQMVIDRVDEKAKSELDSVDEVRAAMLESMNALSENVEDTRADYADGMKEAIIQAALEAAREYAAENREAYILGCDSVMLERTADVAETMVANASRAYRALMAAEYSVDDSDLDTEQRKHLRAYLSTIRYRVQSDKAMAEYIAVIAREELNRINGLSDDDDDLYDVDDSYDGSDDFEDVTTEPVEDISTEETQVLSPVPEAIPSVPEETPPSDSTMEFNFDGLGEFDDPLADMNEVSADNIDDLFADAISFDDASNEIDTTPPKRKKGLFNFSKKKKPPKKRQEKIEEKPRKGGKKVGLIVGGVIGGLALLGALAVGGMYFSGIGAFSPEQSQAKESQTDPRGLYQAGDQYEASMTKGGKSSDVTITLGKFVDDEGEDNDYIIATDADGNEYKITYDKMEALANASNMKKKAEAAAVETNTTATDTASTPEQLGSAE